MSSFVGFVDLSRWHTSRARAAKDDGRSFAQKIRAKAPARRARVAGAFFFRGFACFFRVRPYPGRQRRTPRPARPKLCARSTTVRFVLQTETLRVRALCLFTRLYYSRACLPRCWVAERSAVTRSVQVLRSERAFCHAHRSRSQRVAMTGRRRGCFYIRSAFAFSAFTATARLCSFGASPNARETREGAAASGFRVFSVCSAARDDDGSVMRPVD